MPIASTGRPAVRRFELPNGLRVLLAPIPSSPTVSVWVWYRVGSKNEWPGVTGASHWVEHMLFQGSPRYPKGTIDRAVVAVGGTLNAFTDHDFTAYFTTVPREHLSVPLDIESDRMTRASIAPREVERERTVVRSEREGNENWPEFRVDEEVHALAFERHPYRWEPLGYPEDILSLTPAQLSEYYHRFYGTRNATLVVAGGFETAALAADIRRRFGRLPTTGDDPTVRQVEPPQHGERRALLHGPGTTPFVEIAWKAPAVADPATPAIVLLDVLLGGETRLFAAGAAWGHGGEHPASRLYRRLVDSGLAVSASSEWRPRLHPGLFVVEAQAAATVSIDKVEAALLDEIDRLARRGPGRRELVEARTKVRRGAALAYEGASRSGFRLGYFDGLGPPGFERGLLSAILRTPAGRVRAAAASLFRADTRTVVRYEVTGAVDAA